ncbi:hypothetical protein ACFQ4L_07290 [Lapidilactobacillus mulanensis]|uniref:Uncharacterized protein n=1 Tax=Lapidilactobacillus mulanensis TaxID=2485999 RepID=A0ABW4DQX2_9LACO|nr:hypothetical protein [Lapidilactobacillus mulanensis]
MTLMTDDKITPVTDRILKDALLQYCEFYQIDPQTVVDQAVSDFLGHHDQTVISLVHGYAEMATLNSEICREYSGCEAKID